MTNYNGWVFADAYWQWHKDVYHIRGLEKGDHEMVKERNGPFAGKRINRPVANYKYCHSVMMEFVSKQIGHGVRSQLESLLKGDLIISSGPNELRVWTFVHGVFGSIGLKVAHSDETLSGQELPSFATCVCNEKYLWLQNTRPSEIY